ncbi:hypothetical protein C8J57DRAFT_1498061 [Mycena rebaudengoi]|nr:hypothetical protein C8J57DRAFT_1498061 [Mycena rebaudengoi]
MFRLQSANRPPSISAHAAAPCMGLLRHCPATSCSVEPALHDCDTVPERALSGRLLWGMLALYTVCTAVATVYAVRTTRRF